MAAFSTNLVAILQAVVSRLINQSVFSDSEVFLSLSGESNQVPPGDYLAVISPGLQTAEQPMVMGVGFGFTGQVNVAIWSRNALDSLPRDDSYLTDAYLGLLPKLNAVLTNLQLYMPTDSDGYFMLEEPMRLLAVEPPRKTGLTGWGMVNTSWEVRYVFSGGSDPTEN